MFLNLGHSANQGTDAARVTNPLAHLAADHTEVSLTDIDVIEATTSSQQRKQHDPN